MIQIGILADFDDWRRERKRKEVIQSFHDLYGDNMPDDVIAKLDGVLASIKPCSEMEDQDFTLSDVRYLIGRAKMQGTDMTLDEAASHVNLENMTQELAKLFPAAAPKKKRRRQPVKKS